MISKWFRRICGCISGSNKDQRPKQVSPHGPSTSPSTFYYPENGYESPEHKYWLGNEEEDVDKAAEVFIHRVHKDLKLQKSLSDARYNGYLGRAT